MPDDDRNDQGKQFEDVCKKQTGIHDEHLRETADKAVLDKMRIFEGFLRLCRLISPERVEEVEELYQNIPLDRPEPFNDLLMNIVSATNLLLLSAASVKINVEDALKKGANEILSLQGQLKMERHRASLLQGQFDACQEQLRQTRNLIRLQDKGKKGSNEKRMDSPIEISQAKESKPYKVEYKEPEQSQVTPTVSVRPDKNVQEMEMIGALATWSNIAKGLREEILDTYRDRKSVV
jgi:hypothetical protein